MSDIDTVVVDSLKALDPERPIREADIRRGGWRVRLVPISDIASPIHSITSSARASTVAGVETKRLGGLEVDHDLEFRWMLNGQIVHRYDLINAETGGREQLFVSRRIGVISSRSGRTGNSDRSSQYGCRRSGGRGKTVRRPGWPRTGLSPGRRPGTRYGR